MDRMGSPHLAISWRPPQLSFVVAVLDGVLKRSDKSPLLSPELISSGHSNLTPFSTSTLALFACLISRIFSASQQCFSFTINQQTIFFNYDFLDK
jgi:hypothetical protein